MSKTSQTVEVPERGRKWRMGALIHDRASRKLYRVTSAPIRYHEDCLPMQRVSAVRQPPADWLAVERLLAIMEHVHTYGTHTPVSRGAYGRPADQVAAAPTVEGPRAEWEARRETQSYASYPRLSVQADLLTYVQTNYDDSPTVTWLRDAVLADEAQALIAGKPSLCAYPGAWVRSNAKTEGRAITVYHWATDAASGCLEESSADEVLDRLIAQGEWAPLDSARERADIAEGAWLMIGLSAPRERLVARGNAP